MIHLLDNEFATCDAEVLIPEKEVLHRPATRNPMLLHCGGSVVDRGTLFNVPTPQATRTWFPLPHQQLVEQVEFQLTAAGFTLLAESHALSHEGNRYFGVLEICSNALDMAEDHAWIVGLRNSHDKTFPAGLVAGTRVFVCDNLAFSGLIQIRRKHTRFAVRDLRQLTARAVGQLGDRLVAMDRRIEAYRSFRLSETMAHDLVIRATDCRAITTTQIPEVLSHWRAPEHEEFQSRNIWSLYNAVTEVHKAGNPHIAIARCEALHGLLDGVAGVELHS